MKEESEEDLAKKMSFFLEIIFTTIGKYCNQYKVIVINLHNLDKDDRKRRSALVDTLEELL